MKIPKIFNKGLKVITKKSFKKYVAVGILVLLVTATLRTLVLYVGREIFGISLLILSPINSVVIFGMAFVMKYYLYDRWDMLKD